jgi:uncharacterized repeat protein (TIGR01451 family)
MPVPSDVPATNPTMNRPAGTMPTVVGGRGAEAMPGVPGAAPATIMSGDLEAPGESYVIGSEIPGAAELAAGPGLPRDLLVVRFQGPPGLIVEVLGPEPEAVPTGDGGGILTVGMRLGVGYRLRVSGIPNRPEAVLYPVVQIVGHLHAPPGTDPSKYPVRIVFAEEDLDAAVEQGRLITQVVYLEDPRQAAPVHVPKDEVPTVELSPAEDPMRVAKALGRPMAVVHLGGREPSQHELNGPPVVFPAALGPCPLVSSDGLRCPLACGPCEAPLPKPGLMPKDEYLCDGGDFGQAMSVGRQGMINGIEPRDAAILFSKPTPDQIDGEVAKLQEKLRRGEISRTTFEIQVRRLYQWTVNDGPARLLPTNVVCVYAPRFASVRGSIAASEARTIDVPVSAEAKQRQEGIASRQGPKRFVMRQSPEVARVRDRASSLTERVFAGVSSEVRVLGSQDAVTHPAGHVLVQSPQIARNRDQAVVEKLRQRPEGITTPEGPVVTGIIQSGSQTVMAWKPQELAGVEEPPAAPGVAVIKQVDIVEAEPGDVVTYTISYRNMGNTPVGSISVIDSLLPRLEYVAGSARGPEGTVFTSRVNSAGSTELRWDVKGILPPGATARVSFQAKVR